jgi:hypothetical protein
VWHQARLQGRGNVVLVVLATDMRKLGTICRYSQAVLKQTPPQTQQRKIWAMIARRTTIRQLPLSEVVDSYAPGASPISITTPEGVTIYYTIPLADPDTGKRRDARPRWIAGTFPLFPVVRLADGAPWAEANVWLIDMME